MFSFCHNLFPKDIVFSISCYKIQNTKGVSITMLKYIYYRILIGFKLLDN